MGKLMNINELSDEQLLELLSEEMTIFEDVQGSKIFVNLCGDNITIIPKKINNSPINIVDLTMQKFYNDAYLFFDNLPKNVKALISKNWYFGFEYFSDEQPANIAYNKLPKNKLVLTSIYKNNKFKYTYDELLEYSRLLNCDVLPVIFKGKLSDEAMIAIKMFLNTSKDDLEYVFDENNFSFFFYKLLNPQSKNSFLMEDEFQDNLEKIIISIKGVEDINFEILNPLYNRISSNNKTDYSTHYSMIIIHFLTFCQTINLEELKLDGVKKDDIYIKIICRMFNTYVEQNYTELDNFNLEMTEFFDKEKFKINTELIPNKNTIKILNNNSKFEYIFKCILSSFNRERKNPIALLNGKTLDLFNKFVHKLNIKIDNYVGIRKERELSKLGLVDYGKYFDFKYNTDLTGNVYLQKVQNEIDRELDNDSKKGKTGKGKYKGFNKDFNADGEIGYE